MNFCFNVEKLAREDLKGMEPYDACYAPGVIRLDANENPHGFPPEVKDYIWSQMGDQFFGRYPDPLARELASDLAGELGAGFENILMGNGSDELILNIMLAFGVGRKVFIASPTFSMYSIHARVAGALPVDIKRGPDFEIDVEAMLEEAGRETGIIVLCNPNNPTGNASEIGRIEALARSVDSLVVVDEAYIEFGGETCLSLMGKYPNLLVMRTFSKAFGLAGLRMGYLLAQQNVIRELKRIKQPFNVNSFSQLAARSVLKFRRLFEERIMEIIKDRDSLAAKMKKIKGLKLYPSAANFLCFHTAVSEGEVYCGLRDSGIMIRHIKTTDWGELLRVSVGTERENSVFIEKLEIILDSKAKF